MEKPSSCNDLNTIDSDTPYSKNLKATIIPETYPPFSFTEEGEKLWLFLKDTNDKEDAGLMRDTIGYAEHWASIMEALMGKEMSLEDIWVDAARAAKTAIEADNREAQDSNNPPIVSYHMHLAASRLLRRCWPYGEKLHEAMGDSTTNIFDPEDKEPDDITGDYY